MKLARLLITAAAVSLGSSAAFAGTSSAVFLSDTSVNHLGSFTGTVTYDNVADNLTINLNNTSAGKLTGFAFDVAGDSTAAFGRVKGDQWKDDRSHKGIVNAKPFGNYEAGAALHGKFGAGGKGLAPGADRNFVFTVSGSNAGSLTAADFLSGPTQAEIVASFAGFKHGKKDRVGGVLFTVPSGTTTPDNPGNNIIPANNDPGTNGKNTGGPTNLPPVGNTPVAAVPLPSAAWSGLAMLAILAIAQAARRVRAMIA